MESTETRPIDRVTTDNLSCALRMVGISIPKTTVDKIIDLVELIEEKGDEVSIRDITELEYQWEQLKPKA